jgi:hypothetical protein
LSELLIAGASVDDDMWAAFTRRRHARAKWVIDASTEICQWLTSGAMGDLPGRMHQLNELVTVPA